MRQTTSLGGVVLASVFLIGASAPPSAQLSGVNSSSIATVFPNRRVHTVGDVWMSIGSDGLLGTFADANGGEPDSTSRIPVSFEFPGGSRREHLFGSGLWIGGLVGGVDTVVMAAMFASSGSNAVFTPTQPMQTFYDPKLGHQYFVAHYADTSLNGDRYPTDRSLGVEIRQTSHAFESRPYDRFVIVEYLIRNISRHTIHRTHVGFFADPDVFNELRKNQPESGPYDDLTGYLRDRGIAYTFDNDGDVATRNDSTFEDNWCPSGFGLAPVTIDPIPCCTTFNWWATNFGNVDWGPSKARVPYMHYDDPAIPYGMNGMYRTMANSEIDYDQIEVAVDKSAAGWRNPPIALADHIANGLDTRWTLSYSFGDLAPYDSLRLVMAYVIGDSIHTTPGRYPDPLHPDTFLAGLDFSDLRENADRARLAWGHRFTLDRASPVGFEVAPISDRVVRCSWDAAPAYGVRGYRLYKRTLGGAKWQLLAEVSADNRAYEDRDLVIGTKYEYAVSSLFWATEESASSRPVFVKVGRPIDSPVIRVRNTPAEVEINWQSPRQDSGFATYALLNLYRMAGDTGRFAFYQSFPIATKQPGSAARSARVPIRRDPFGMQPWVFVDDSVTPGVIYHYSATFTNDFGIEGPMSPTDSTVPMPLHRPGLVILGTSRELVLIDTLRYFYGTWASRVGFDTITPVASAIMDRPDISYPNLTLEILAKYQTVVVVAENRNSFPDGALDDRLYRYLTFGGKCVFVTRNHGNGGGVTVPGRPAPIVERFLGLHGTWYEETNRAVGSHPLRVVGSVYFQNAISSNPEYPTIEADSSLGWRTKFLYPLDWYDTLLAGGRVPQVGALDSLEIGTIGLYSYGSAYADWRLAGKPIAVKRITDSSAAILFNFPLSLMKHEQAWQALTQAVADLGVDTTNYWPPAQLSTQNIIEWLYGHPTGGPDPAWDVNRDGVIDIRDVVARLRR